MGSPCRQKHTIYSRRLGTWSMAGPGRMTRSAPGPGTKGRNVNTKRKKMAGLVTNGIHETNSTRSRWLKSKWV